MEQELDLETGIKVLEYLDEAKRKILNHVMNTASPADRIQVLDASIAAATETLAKATPDNPFIETDMREVELLESRLVQAVGWGKTYAQITRAIEDLELMLGAPPKTREDRQLQLTCH